MVARLPVVARWALPLILAVGGGWLLGSVLRALVFLATALCLRLVASAAAPALLLVPWLDPVYTRDALHSLSDVRVPGVALAGGLGASAHALAPWLFSDAARADGRLFRVLLEPGGALLARQVAATVAHAVVLAVGLLAVRAGLLRHRSSLVYAGVAVQAQVAVGIVQSHPSVSDVEATGLSFALNALLPGFWQRSTALSDALPSDSWPWVAAGLVALALVFAYAAAAGIATACVAVWRQRREAAGQPRPPVQLVRQGTRAFNGAVAASLVLSSAAVGSWSGPPPATPAATQTAPTPGPAVAAAEALPSPTESPSPASGADAPAGSPSSSAGASFGQDWDRWFKDPTPPTRRQPSRVEVQGSNYQYQLLVNGQPQVIRGMGLNTQYQQLPSSEQRVAQLDADLSAISRMGVNTVVGWDGSELDETLMDRAAAHSIGVVAPFDLDPDADYTDAAYRAGLTVQVMAWVERYRSFPALRMWGLGNEVLHKIVHPAWVGPQDPAQAQNARAFSAWLVATADAIHQADPDHPVTYREAEDAFTPWVAEALHDRGGGPRPWFVWGTNSYTEHLQDIVNGWPNQKMDVPLWVSEFAPGGLAVPDRPDGFRQMWGYVRLQPQYVLGGAVYAWTRNGPEGVDRNFGLTDDGAPVDGRSLDALAELFHQDD